MVKLGWLVCLVANVACLRSTAFHCTSDAQCTAASGAGTCERVGYCSFADASCDGGRRFGDLADALSNTCVSHPDAGVDAAPVFVSIGGTTTGLTGSGLVLRDTAADSLAITANGPFTFAMQIIQGTVYDVTVATPPSGQDVYVGRGKGTANGPVTSVVVSCFPAGSDPGVRCDTGIFCSSTEQCCFDANAQSGTCGGLGSGCARIPMPCDSSQECSGGSGACCAQYHQGNQALQAIGCVATPAQCVAQGSGATEILCDPRDLPTPCQNGQTCTGSSRLGPAYHTCQ